ncbi:hypothetical protein ACFLRZ_02800 [Bacteroidota bacterium]
MGFIVVIFLFLSCPYTNLAQITLFAKDSDIVYLYGSLIDDKTYIAMEDEKEVDDIPFNTQKIVMEYYEKQERNNNTRDDLNFIEMEEEQDTTDFLFDKKQLYYYLFIDSKEYLMTDEEEVDDIPFDTRKIYEKYKKNSDDQSIIF